MSIGPPPPPTELSRLDPLFSLLPAGTLLYRVHGQGFAANAFNPGVGAGGRFHFIRAGGAGRRVPSLYGAEDPLAALAETIFQDVAPRPARGKQLLGALLGRQDLLVVGLGGIRHRSHVQGRMLSTLRLRRALRLVRLQDLGLRRLGLSMAEMIASGPESYPTTRAWAEALHRGTAAQGLLWTSRQFDSRSAVHLFGDRVGSEALEVVDRPLALGSPPGLYLVYEVAEAAGITVFHD
jgi:hypothetical protein